VTPQTSLLYAGEQFDTNLQMYYNRARYYDQNTGRFNRTDPFAGSPQDPQSLHKYLYCHANPVNEIDPTGHFGIVPSGVYGVVLTVALLVLWASFFAYRYWSSHRHNTPAENNYQNDILKVKINPIFNFPIHPTEKQKGIFKQDYLQFEQSLLRAKDFWLKTAGIELSWDKILVVNDPEFLTIKDQTTLIEALEWYYIGEPVVLNIEKGDDKATGGLTPSPYSKRYGCAVPRWATSVDVAHELGHVFIHSHPDHVKGAPLNLLAEDDPSVPQSINNVFLSQKQVDWARGTVIENGWAVR
jgi:RHS repeat-associated protein